MFFFSFFFFKQKTAYEMRISDWSSDVCSSDLFKRLGVVGDWKNPYTTMSFAAEAQIVREIQKFLMNGGLFKGSKPVMWSVVERTALAEAEEIGRAHV